MPEKEQQDKTLSEIVVKEAVGKGLDSPMRDSILEAVEEADSPKRRRRLPLVGAVFGLGAALGFLAGQQSSELEESPLEDLEEPEIIEDVTERVEGEAETETDTELTDDEESEMVETESEESSSRLPKLLLALAAIGGAVVLRRRLSGESEEEWEPIEEFEPATTAETDEEGEDGEETGAEGKDEHENDEAGEEAEADESEE